MLAATDGERELTDLRHIGQLLHHEATTERLGRHRPRPPGCARRIREAADDVHDEDRSRRLESDSAAVQVLTIHRCKGLRVPDRLLPVPVAAAVDPRRAAARVPRRGRRRPAHDRRGGPDRTGDMRRKEQHVAEVHGEALRLAYVALTRARHQTVCTGRARGTAASRRWPGCSSAPSSTPTQSSSLRARRGATSIARVQAIAADAPGTIAIERSTGGRGAARWTPASTTRSCWTCDGSAARSTAAWRRASYSGLTSACP